MTALALQTLIDESGRLETCAAAIQGDQEVLLAKTAIDAFVNDYHEWYARALDLLPDDLEERFLHEFDSGIFKGNKIQDFLTGPDTPSVIQLDEPNPLISYWQHPFDSAFRGPLLTQRQILAEAKQRLQGTGETSEHLALLERICRGFGDFVRPLEDRGRNREPFVVEDEYDVQTLIHAQLSVFFDDVRPGRLDAGTSGARSRVDFLLKSEKIVVETKMTRSNLGAKEVGEELIVDHQPLQGAP
jgi:REase_DpnII-MboI